MRIGELVAQYRDEHRMSQKEFANKCGLSGAIISFLERGERTDGTPYLPKFDTIRKVAHGMGMSAEALLARCEDFDLDISVGPDEKPLIQDFIRELQNQSPDEQMLIQVYRLIPIEHRFEAMQAVFNIKDKYMKI